MAAWKADLRGYLQASLKVVQMAVKSVGGMAVPMVYSKAGQRDNRRVGMSENLMVVKTVGQKVRRTVLTMDD